MYVAPCKITWMDFIPVIATVTAFGIMQVVFFHAHSRLFPSIGIVLTSAMVSRSVIETIKEVKERCRSGRRQSFGGLYLTK